jgi:hypothetical protein
LIREKNAREICTIFNNLEMESGMMENNKSNCAFRLEKYFFMKQPQFNSQTQVYWHWLLLFTLVHLFSCTSTPDHPNIILCMADDQGWGDVGYYSHPDLKTPNLDNMAASALRFDHFYAAAPVCSPTRGSVLTGRHPNRFGCFTWGSTLRPQETTIAEALKQAGYSTGHFGKWHLGSVRQGSPVNPGASGNDRRTESLDAIGDPKFERD